MVRIVVKRLDITIIYIVIFLEFYLPKPNSQHITQNMFGVFEQMSLLYGGLDGFFLLFTLS